MKPSPHELILIRNTHIMTGKSLPRERFVVFRVQSAGLPNEYREEFWSLDDVDAAKDLCRALVTDSNGAYILDTVTRERLLDLKAIGH